MIERDSTVLPDPDSPTMPSVRPAIERERHPVDGFDAAARRAERRPQVLDRQQQTVLAAAFGLHSPTGPGR